MKEHRLTPTPFALLAALVLALPATASAADQLEQLCQQDGFACIALHRSPQATARWREQCEHGRSPQELTACVVVALRILDQPRTARVYREANTFFKRACDGGHSGGCSLLAANPPEPDVQQLGAQCEKGEPLACTHFDTPTVDDVLRKGCTAGSQLTCVFLGDSLFAKSQEPRTVADAMKLFRTACQHGIPEGCTHLGAAMLGDPAGAGGPMVVRDGERKATPQQRRDARRYLERGCRTGDPRGCLWVGEMDLRAARTASAKQAACKLVEKGCLGPESCDMQAGYDLDDCGSDVFKRLSDYIKGEDDCEKGDGIACSQAADALAEGVPGVAADAGTINELMRKACEGKYDQACVDILPNPTLRDEAAKLILKYYYDKDVMSSSGLLPEAVRHHPEAMKIVGANALKALDEGCKPDRDLDNCVLAADSLHSGTLGVHDEAWANRLLDRACEARNAEACQRRVDWLPPASPEADARRKTACLVGSKRACDEMWKGKSTPRVAATKVKGLSAPTRRLLFVPGSTQALLALNHGFALVDLPTATVLAQVDLTSPERKEPPPPQFQGYRQIWTGGAAPVPLWDAKAQRPYAIVGLYDNEYGLWRPGAAVPVQPIELPDDPQIPLEVDASQRLLISNHGDFRNSANGLDILDLATLRPLTSPISFERGVSEWPGFQADGHSLVVAVENPHGLYKVLLYDLSTGQKTELADQAAGFAVDWKHRRIAIGIRALPGHPLPGATHTGLVLRSLDSSTDQVSVPEETIQLAFSPDGGRLYATTPTGFITLDARTGERLGPSQPDIRDDHAWALRIDPSGRYALLFSWDVTVIDLEAEAPKPPSSPVPAWAADLKPLPYPTEPQAPPIHRTAHAKGTVRLDGKPVAGADVTLTPNDREWPNALALAPIHTKTDANGVYDLPNIPRINWNVLFESGRAVGTAAFNARQIRVQTTLDGYLQLAPRLSGVVFDPTGKPVADARVSFVVPPNSMASMPSDARTDAAGRFLIKDMWPGAFLLQVETPDGVNLRRHITIEKDKDLDLPLHLLPKNDPHMLRVRLVTRSGKAIPHVRVDYWNMEYRGSGTTNENGDWFLDTSDAPGSYRIRYYYGSYENAEVTLDLPTSKDAVLRIPDASIRAVDLPANQLLGWNLVCDGPCPPDTPNSFTTGDVNASAAVWGGLAAGKWKFTARTIDGRVGRGTFTLVDGEHKDLTLTWTLPGRLRGRLLDARSRHPIKDIEIESNVAPLDMIGSSSAVRSGPDGRFELTGIAPGRHGFRIKASGYDDRYGTYLVDEKGTTDVGDILLEKGSLRGDSFGFDEAGPRLNWTADGVRVKVLPDTPSAWKGLDGATIVEINGLPLTEARHSSELDDLREYLDLRQPAQVVYRDAHGKRHTAKIPVTAWKRVQ